MNGKADSLVLAKSLALVEKTKQRVKQIDGANFPTATSESARSLLLTALNEIANPSHRAAMSPEVLYNSLIKIQSLVDEVEMSTSDRIAWPLVSYCDEIWKALIGDDSRALFYSLTKEHNYFIESFSDKLAQLLSNLLPENEIKRIIGTKKLYCLKMASMEDENLPLYANIGHEFGHALYWTNQIELLRLLDRACDDLLDKIVEQLNQSGHSQTRRLIARIGQIIICFATELFCDLIGVFISGPGFLLSLQEMSWGVNQNIWSVNLVPKELDINAYPSFQFRIRQIWDSLNVEEMGNNVRGVFEELFDDPMQELADYLSDIDTSHSNDRVKVFSNPDSDKDKGIIESLLSENLSELKDSLQEFLQLCSEEFLEKKFNSLSLLPFQDKDLAELLKRLSYDIIPNIVPDDTLLGQPANFAMILNASAMYRIKVLLNRDEEEPPEKAYHDLQKLERLAAKSFEVSYIQAQYSKWKEEQ
ncbi:MAG: hypothetical protein KDN19_12285 [Verrucomicrobiae bacterium]|nr:hypothetical protein [Verrucomicrobiae bacterium]